MNHSCQILDGEWHTVPWRKKAFVRDEDGDTHTNRERDRQTETDADRRSEAKYREIYKYIIHVYISAHLATCRQTDRLRHVLAPRTFVKTSNDV